ncbi:MAG TPA: spermidine/putrescine ABC transporter substrate-binding protein [Solirubrobacteraceae bacterium]|nr:spermidine/putrescine ABC transporter substrate-binding protein [Solirubrobacteraceae bacterium]
MPPESFESALERLLAQHRHNRRRFVGRAGSAALATSALGAFLSACGGAEGQNEDEEESAEREPAGHPKEEFDEVVVSNWTLYIDKKLLKDFRAKHGARVKYIEDINDNQEFFGKVRQPLDRGDGIGRDIVVLTDWMAGRWIRLDYVEPIDKKNVPNEVNLRDNLRNVTFDRGRRFSLPWQSGMTAIGYDAKQTGGEIKSIEQFFDPKYKGKVTMLSDAREATSMVMLMQGKRPDEAGIDDVLAAVEYVDEQNRKGHIRRFTGNDYTKDLAAGNIAMAQAYSGDVIQLTADNPNLKLAIPEQGAILWSDNMMIPQKPRTAYGAEVFMNWAYDPQVAAKIAAYVNYVTPVKGTQEILAESNPKLAEDPLIFPSAADLSRLSGYPNLSVEEEQQMNEAFEQVVGA